MSFTPRPIYRQEKTRGRNEWVAGWAPVRVGGEGVNTVDKRKITCCTEI